MDLYAVFRRRSGDSDQARPIEEQAGWTEHAAYMMALAAGGFVILAGPLDDTGALIVVRAESAGAVGARFADDPWTVSGLLDDRAGRALAPQDRDARSVIEIRPVRFSQALFAPMLAEAGDGDGRFLLRLRDQWLSGAVRFDKEGEILLGALRGRPAGGRRRPEPRSLRSGARAGAGAAPLRDRGRARTRDRGGDWSGDCWNMRAPASRHGPPPHPGRGAPLRALRLRADAIATGETHRLDLLDVLGQPPVKLGPAVAEEAEGGAVALGRVEVERGGEDAGLLARRTRRGCRRARRR